MRTDPADTQCPHCGTPTAIARGEAPTLPGRLHLHEFEILVRSEWRRRLGREAYDRAHEVRLVRTLAGVAHAEADTDLDGELQDELDQVVADIAAVGRGRAAVRREVDELLQAMETVFTNAGADPEATGPTIRSARRVLEVALGYSLD